MDLKVIEEVIDRKVRPALHAHNGDIKIVSFKDGVLTFKLIGECSNCPSAYITAENVVGAPIMEELPEIKKVVLDTTVSDEIWNLAKDILKKRHENDNHES